MLIYLGVLKDGKIAVFLVDKGVTAVGDGAAADPTQCETLRLRAGETEFFDVVDEAGAVTDAVPARPDQDPQEHVARLPRLAAPPAE